LREEDIPALLLIEVEANPLPWSAGMFRQELANPLGKFFVYREGGTIVGYAGFWDMVGHGHSSNLAVEKSRRGRGVGAGIVGLLLAAMRECGITGATLEVRESNTAATRLYERCGFVLEGRRKGYYRNGEAALIYSLALS
jgi:ribosomal-protein-alanine N-acetyltransferase